MHIPKLRIRSVPAVASSSLPLELRQLREGVLLLRASNDTAVDRHGTIITVEGLHDWWEGYKQHRTVNLQHNLNLRGIKGRPQVGMAMRADFAPQLELEIRVDDPAAKRLIEERKIKGGSLEFVPLPEGTQRRTVEGREVEVYHRLSSEPEMCGLALCDIPSVPEADILAMRDMPANWVFAVVDPRVINGEITDPELIAKLRWLPHHDPVTHLVDKRQLEQAVGGLEGIVVPPEASLSKAQILERARQHLARHGQLGLGMRALELRAVPPNPPNYGKSRGAWSAPNLSDFTSSSWDSLSDSERRDIARRFAWARELPPKTYGNLKLPHHNPNGDVVWQGVVAAMAALNGGRGGVEGLGGDREAVYRHLTNHYQDFDEDAPPLKRTFPEGGIMDKAKQWIQARAAQLQAEGMEQAKAEAQAKSELEAQPSLRAKLEGGDEEKPNLFQRLFGGANVTVNMPPGQADQGEQQPLQARSTPEKKGDEKPKEKGAKERWLESRAATLEAEGGSAEEAKKKAGEELAQNAELQARLEPGGSEMQRQVREALFSDPAIRAALSQPENPLAAIAAGMHVRSKRLEPDQLLEQVLLRTVIPQIERRGPTAQEKQEAYNLLKAHGISERALTIEANSTVVFDDLARQFIIKPEPDIIGRNHFVSVPMGGTKKRTFPRFDRSGITHTWSRTSTTTIADSEPTLDTFDIEVTELNSKVNVPDSFSIFNAQGGSFIQQILLPAMRGAAQYEEDRAFFLSTGASTDPTTFKGLEKVTGVTTVSAGTNGDAFDASILGSLLRAMPVNYRNQIDRLAFYLPVSLGDDYGDILAARATPGGDAWIQRFANKPGPMPIAVFRGIGVYTVSHLPVDETQGTADNAATIYLVHRGIPVIGDALSLRIEPYRAEDFITKLQLEEFVGLGYQWPKAIVRRIGVLPAA